MFELFQRNAQSLEGLSGYFAFFGFGTHTLTGRGEPERLMAVDVVPRFFEVLGVQPACGRLFTADEHRRSGPRAAVLGHGLWQRRFGSDPAVVGSAVAINGQPVTAVGIMPATFDFASVFTPGTRVDLFVPADLEQMRPWGNTLALVDRMRAGVTVEQGAGGVSRADTSLAWREQAIWGIGGTLSTLKSYVSGRMRRSLFVLWAAVDSCS